MSYLGQLTLRLLGGAARLPEELRRRHLDFLRACQRPDGGFAGRRGPSDLYYTGFGLRALGLLGALDEDTACRAAGFLATQVAHPRSAVDFLSLVYSAALLDALGAADPFTATGSDRSQATAAYLAPLRRADGGYAAVAGGHASTYHTFLAISALDLLGLERGPAEPVCQLLQRRRREDGGFVELDPLPHSGTNPTAAAVGALRMLGALDEALRTGAARFLAGRQLLEGGFAANTRLPLADLLSTFTALVALTDLEALESVDRRRAHDYVLGLQDASGGFQGGVWDETCDVEYTFYGLGSLALLAPEEQP